MSAIYRYEVPVDALRHTVRLFGEIVHVATRDPRKVEFWALHSEGGESTDHTFLVVGTGHQLPPDLLRVVGTAVGPSEVMGIPLPNLVWHLIEVKP